MARFAIVNMGDSRVETVVEAAVLAEVRPLPGCNVVPCDDVTAWGDTYDGATFTKPAPPPPGDVTLGQLIDIALEIGLISPADVDPVITSVDMTKATVDAEGSYVLGLDSVDAVVADAVAKGVLTKGEEVDVPALDSPVVALEVKP